MIFFQLCFLNIFINDDDDEGDDDDDEVDDYDGDGDHDGDDEVMLSPDVKFRDVSSDYRKLELSW